MKDMIGNTYGTDKRSRRGDKKRAFAASLAGRAALIYADVIMLAWTICDRIQTGEMGAPFYLLVTQNVVYLIFLWCGESRGVRRNSLALAVAGVVSLLFLIGGVYMVVSSLIGG